MGFFDTIFDTSDRLVTTGQEQHILPEVNGNNDIKSEAASPDPATEAPKKTACKPEKVSFLRPCPLCGGRTFVYGTTGGFFCAVCQPGKSGKSVEATGPDRQTPEREPDQGLQVSGNFQTSHRTTTSEKENFSAAWPWLQKNLSVLLASGWSSAALFARGKHRHPYGRWGVAWFPVWLQPSLIVSIGIRGAIVFTYRTSGREVKQRAYPPRQTMFQINTTK
jgi:hypothetical protein